MFIKKINLYLFTQIFKYFFLVLFIFLTVAWLLQVTRLFTITNFMQINILELFLLSLFLIPNIITVIVPFILIFGLLLCFIKLNKDNELISILSLGLGLRPFKYTLFYFSIIIIFIFSFLNFYIAPTIYEKYKIQEYDLRNNLDFNNMAFSNFISINKSTILDFNKQNNEYEDIFINFYDGKDNIIYAKKGNIFNENKYFNFQLNEGFKLTINQNNQIEKLEFLNYLLKIEKKDLTEKVIYDKNTYTIFDDIKSKNYINISFKIIDVLLILYVIIIFYFNNLKKLNFKIMNCIFFSLFCISILLINQILKNSEIALINYCLVFSSVILFSIFLAYLKKNYEQN